MDKTENLKEKTEIKYKTTEEYADSLRQWMNESYKWYLFHFHIPQVIWQDRLRNYSSPIRNGNSPNSSPGISNFSLFQSSQANNARVVRAFTTGSEHTIAPLWKRLVAELIDCFLVFFLKLLVAFIAVDTLGTDIVKNFHPIKASLGSNEHGMAFEFPWALIIIDLVQRFLVSVLEALMTQKGDLQPGGATPGKRFMGLRIVSCNSIVPREGNRAIIYPAGDLGLSRAFVRSFAKNFSYALFLPTSGVVFFFTYNRASYDLLCGSIVVEDV